MRVLITGGAGFIGSHIADRLVARGDEVTVVDNLLTGRRENVPEGVKFFRLRIERTEPVDHFDVAIHAAASYNDPTFWGRDTDTNVRGATNVARMCQKVDARLVYFQTSLCYGPPQTAAPITLDAPLNPQGSYAITKTAGEQFIIQSGLDYVSFRLANIYGPRNLSGPVPTFYKKLRGGEPCTVSDTRRDFVYVDDLIDVVMQAIDGKGHGIYHVSHGEEDYSIVELHGMVSSAVGILDNSHEVIPGGPDDVKTLRLDPSRTHEDFDFNPSTPLSAGIAKAVEWYEEHGVTKTYTHLRG